MSMHHFQIALAIVLPIIFACLILFIGYKLLYRPLSQKHTLFMNNSRRMHHDSSAHIPMIENSIYVDTDIAEAIARGDADEFEISHYFIHLGSEIGQGAFGRVFRARADNVGGRSGSQIVAVKQLRRESYKYNKIDSTHKKVNAN